MKAKPKRTIQIPDPVMVQPRTCARCGAFASGVPGTPTEGPVPWTFQDYLREALCSDPSTGSTKARRKTLARILEEIDRAENELVLEESDYQEVKTATDRFQIHPLMARHAARFDEAVDSASILVPLAPPA